MTSSGWRAKVEPRLAATYDRAAAEGKLESRVGVLVRVTGADLVLPGLTLGTRVDDVATANLILVHLPTIAGAVAVSYVELAGAVWWDAS